MIDMIGGRKVLAALVVLIVGIGVVLMKGDIPPNLLSLMQVVFAAFVAGNGVEHVAGAYAETKAPMVETAATPPIDLGHIEASLNEVKEEAAQAKEAATLGNQGIQYIIQRAFGGGQA
jgi:hypothetical protein